MSKDLEQAIREKDQAIASAKAEINLSLKQLPEDIRQRLEPLVGTEGFKEEIDKLYSTYSDKIKELEEKLAELDRD